jgi:hypothetical protein
VVSINVNKVEEQRYVITFLVKEENNLVNIHGGCRYNIVTFEVFRMVAMKNSASGM